MFHILLTIHVTTKRVYFNILNFNFFFQVQIAIPDFESGAMENFGLITYRELSLLYNPKTDSTINQKYITLVISHEIVHQWFGNLVTLQWWNDLWYFYNIFRERKKRLNY